jgi:hypothetical protein
MGRPGDRPRGRVACHGRARGSGSPERVGRRPGRLAEKTLTVKLIRLIAEGDAVVAITEVTAGGETGEDADVFILRDGKTVRVETHGDTSLLERVYGKKQLAAG